MFSAGMYGSCLWELRYGAGFKHKLFLSPNSYGNKVLNIDQAQCKNRFD